ncbi:MULTISPECIES: hypothetical protein [Methanosarcina]|uniref:Glycosyltransferase RgtA/B/C/D-like domain-containing protein n=2 Tax=Methanosarcina barkeri TaxID=2208 RepID=A0A0E3QXI9_METBA|nr:MULTISPECIES: hypothetical protein [Methanosarcina]AKB56364.1 hypothetical protein MSBRM_3366 [Methanosarcina barkeri MS]AKB59835.1 hypothetical protein MSBR2_3319 [Methanosarcina barkeri 227]OEC93659.1 hypothetical protein A9239_02140 [Methanosarcina sp. A14]
METAKGYVERVTTNLDVILSVMGFGLGLLIISLYYIIDLNQKDIGIAILSSCLIYFIFRNKFKSETAISSREDKFKSILEISFYLIFLACVFIYSTNLYYRPISSFILICILAAIIASQILYVREGDGVTSLLLQIFLLSILIRVGIFYNFPSLMGYDAYFHASMARAITDTGFVAPIETSSKYFYYPLFHIFVSIIQVMSETDIKDAIFYSIGFASVFSTVGIYLIGKKLEGVQMGLLATLLINLNNHNIVAGITNITPGSLVLCYFIFIIYAIFSEKQSLRYTGFILLITVLMVLTHQLTTFVVFLSLVSICAGKYLHNHVYKSLFAKTNNFNYILFFVISLQTYWMFTYVNSNTSFLEMVLSPLMDVLQIGSSYSSAELIMGPLNNQETLETLLLHISYLALPFFAIGGVLAWLSRENIKKVNKFSIALVVIILYGLAYGIPLLGMRNFLTSRWFPLIAVFLVLVSASYMLKLVSLLDSKKAKIPVMFTIILLFSFVMVTTPGINKDNPLVAKDTTVRNQFKSIEIEAIKTVTVKCSGNILMDSPYDSCLFYRDRAYDTRNATYFNIQHIQTGEIDGDPTILLRKSTVKEPISINDPERYGINIIQTLPEGFFNRFNAHDYARVYDNDEVFAYTKEGKTTRN